MTREEARKAAEIMLAYANGENIQFSQKGVGYWASCEDPVFNFNFIDYRVKSKPKYRPFKDGDECFEEMRKHEPFGWLKSKSENYKTSIIDADSTYIGINNYCHTYEYAFSNFEFIDGTPFGIKEDWHE